jgi:Mg2+/Co2+ transporter CorB
MRPFLSIISKINIFFLKLFADKTATNHDNEELRGFIDLYAIAKTSSEDKNKVREERAMLRSILDLDDTDVEKIMVHRKEVYMINYDQEPVEIIEQLASSRYTRIPVWKDSTSNITGVIHIREALKLLTAKNEDINHDDINSIITEPWFIPETVSLVDQMRAFQKRQEHFSVVVDEYGSFMGIVTLEDIIEEIIGDIKDEHDMPIKGVYKNSDGSYNVKGNITIRDLNRELNLGLDEDDATTIAGFVINIARKIPDNHQVFSHQNFSFEVIRRHKNQLTLIKIKELNQL